MAPGFDPDWLAARRPFDDAALDRAAIAAIRSWAAALPPDQPIRVADLGSGTGVALRRAADWLAGRSMVGFAVESNPGLLEAAPAAWAAELGVSLGRPEHPSSPGEGSQLDALPSEGPGRAGYQLDLGGRAVTIVPVLADLLQSLAPAGGPPDGSVDLVLGHALADLLPLDVLARRVAALLRPGGLAHLALTYDGKMAFEPPDAGSDARVIAAYHDHMDRARLAAPTYGGSTAGRRLSLALAGAGLEIVRSGPAIWKIRPGRDDPAASRALLGRMIAFVVGSVLEVGRPPAADVRRWEASRRRQLDAGRLGLRVWHQDVLARRAT